MSEQPTGQPTAQQAAEAALAIALAHQAAQAALRQRQLLKILKIFRGIDMKNPIGDWTRGGIGEQVYVLLSVTQEAVASQAEQYVRDSLAVQGIIADIPAIDPRGFAGIASDGRNLESLLAGAPIRTSARLRHGDTPQRALESGSMWLKMAVETQVADAGRAANSAAIVSAEPRPVRKFTPVGGRAARAEQIYQENKARREAERAARGRVAPTSRATPSRQIGWIRVLTPPSCDRCIILAGRWYKWNAGFERHPACDCIQVPATKVGESDPRLVDPEAYFKSLSPTAQDAAFGKANAEAIRSGANISQVVNSHSKAGAVYVADGRQYTNVGGTRLRPGTVPSGVLRPTVWQIYRDAGNDRGEAIRNLRKFRYLK